MWKIKKNFAGVVSITETSSLLDGVLHPAILFSLQVHSVRPQTYPNHLHSQVTRTSQERQKLTSSCPHLAVRLQVPFHQPLQDRLHQLPLHLGSLPSTLSQLPHLRDHLRSPMTLQHKHLQMSPYLCHILPQRHVGRSLITLKYRVFRRRLGQVQFIGC